MPITPEEYAQLEEKEISIRSKIINQPPPCKVNKPNEKSIFVEKIQLKTNLTENEQFISNLIKTHPFGYLYFQPLIEIHPLSIGTIASECDQPDIQSANQNELIEGKYKEVGEQTLEDFLTEQIQTNPNTYIQLLVHSHLQLLDSIAILQSLEPPVVHFHITPQTILYDKTNGTPVLTDFRLAFTKTIIETPEESDELFPSFENHPSWPVEVYLLSQMLNPLQTQTQTQTPSPNYSSESQTSLKNKDKEQLKSTYLSWDVYAINQTIFSFINHRRTSLETQEGQSPISHTGQSPISHTGQSLITNLTPTSNIPFVRTYEELLIKELSAEPTERSSIPSLQTKIRDIFQSVPKKEYLDFLRELQQ